MYRNGRDRMKETEKEKKRKGGGSGNVKLVGEMENKIITIINCDNDI